MKSLIVIAIVVALGICAINAAGDVAKLKSVQQERAAIVLEMMESN
jgi:hypothetical protein